MDNLPDLDTITTLLSAVEGRNPATTSVSRFDEDHNVLLSTQAEILGVLSGPLPDSDDKDDLRALLDRIDNDIDMNRSLRAEAKARQTEG